MRPHEIQQKGRKSAQLVGTKGKRHSMDGSNKLVGFMHCCYLAGIACSPWREQLSAQCFSAASCRHFGKSMAWGLQAKFMFFFFFSFSFFWRTVVTTLPRQVNYSSAVLQPSWYQWTTSATVHFDDTLSTAESPGPTWPSSISCWSFEKLSLKHLQLYWNYSWKNIELTLNRFMQLHEMN